MHAASDIGRSVTLPLCDSYAHLLDSDCEPSIFERSYSMVGFKR